MNSLARTDGIVWLLLVALSLSLGLQYVLQVDYPQLNARMSLHNEIVRGTALAPYRYRVLIPFAMDFVIRLLNRFFSYERAFLISYGVYEWFAIFVALMMLFTYLRLWFTRDQSLLGVGIASMSMLVGFADHYFQPWSFAELALLSLGLVLIYWRRHTAFAIVLLVASLNRETSLFMVLVYAVTNVFEAGAPRLVVVAKASALRILGFLAIWSVVYFGLRYVLGRAPYVASFGHVLFLNIQRENLARTLAHWSTFLGVFWVFAVQGYRHAPTFVRQTTVIVPFYVAAVIAFTYWWEVRILMVLYPIVVPLSLAFIFSRTTASTDHERETARALVDR